MKINNYVKNKSKNKIRILQEEFSLPQLDSTSLNTYRKILEQDGEIYTDEDISIIYYYLKEMAGISVLEYLKSENYEKSDFNVKS